jgi:hypothetical protein
MAEADPPKPLALSGLPLRRFTVADVFAMQEAGVLEAD